MEGEGKEVVRDPYVVGSGQLERLHCSAAGNGRAAHQAVVVIEMGVQLGRPLRSRPDWEVGGARDLV